MSVFGDILRKIFPGNHPAATGSAGQDSATTKTGAAPAPAAGATSAAGAQPAGSTAAAPPKPAVPPVDVEAVLTALAEKNPQKLNWRASIVDLMKLLQLDSSLAARQGLAEELGYTGDTHDSATMNIWLHKQVMKKLADNGGKVPEDLKS